MASSLLLFSVAVALLFSPAVSQACKSQKFPNRNATFVNCEDLPTLKAVLHWTYNPAARPDPTLALAFVASPPKPNGWIAWALNPTGGGMVGAQSLIAFKDNNGSVVVKTYNISSYGGITESRISYEVLSKSAESGSGKMTIFATLAMPGAGSEVNQVWQVGGSVTNGVPVKHDFSPENLKSTGTLRLGGTTTKGKNVKAPSPSPTGSPPSSTGQGSSGGAPTRSQSGNETGGSWRVSEDGVWMRGVLVLLGIFLGI